MNPLLVVLLLALIGLLGAQFTFARRTVPLGPQIFLAIGGPFLFLGFLLGPHALHVLSLSTISQLTPLLALGLGWVGLLFGLQLDRSQLRQFPTRYLALAWLQATVAFAVVFGIGLSLVGVRLALDLDVIVLVAAATACVSTPAAIALISNTYKTRGQITRFLFFAASLDAAVGIIAIGLTQAVYHSGMPGREISLSAIELIATSVLLGCFFGVLFLSMTRIRPRTQEHLLLLIGLVLFAAGTSFYLSLSPLFVCMIAGIVIGNLSPIRRRVYSALSSWQQPIYIMTLVLAGALLEFSSWWIAPLVAVYIAARILAKWIGGLLAARIGRSMLRLPGSFGLALTPQGGFSLAIAISFVLIYVPTAPELQAAVNIFFGTVVIAVGISDLIGPFLVRAVLERAGELDRRVTEVAVRGNR